MGCDIHLYVEKFDGKKWVHVQEDVMKDDNVPAELSFFNTRSYSLFAILANVRNNGNFNPISEPKELPEDCSDSIKTISDWDGGHSHSWLTLKEIFEFDWTQSVKREGWMDGGFWSECIPRLLRLGTPENVRIVFWFDN